MIRVLLVDDEPLAIEALRGLLAEEPDVEIAGACLNGREAVDAIGTTRPDLVLLDVQMPVFDGFEVIEELDVPEIPLVVFVTAYDQYALRAFAVHAVDYLLKPVGRERLREAICHARQILAGRQERETNRRLLALLGEMEARRPALDRFVIREQDRVRFIKVQDVDAIEAAGVYAVLHRGRDVFVLREALSTLEARLGTGRFLRVHRSWLVNADRIAEVRGAPGRPREMRLTTGLSVPVSRRHRLAVGTRRVTCALLAAVVLGTTGTVGSARNPSQDFVLGPCAGDRGPAQAECGRLAVYENRAAGRGRRIDIHFMVIRAEKPGARQALFMFAGGPGQGSMDMAGVASGWARPLRAQQDIVLVDQRGTGRSHPLDCDFGAEANLAAAFGHVFAPRGVARCRAALEQDADLTRYTTDAAIDDVEDIRARLGYDTVALFGGSYGTRMAQAYLRRHPRRVRAVVLDGVVPFDLGGPLTYARTAQQALDRVFAACRAEPACGQAHPDPNKDMAAILGRLATRPAPATVVRRSGQAVNVSVSRGDFGYAVRGIMYDGRAALELPDMLGRAAATGDLSEFAQRYLDREVRMEAGLAHGLHLSVFCAEDIPYPTEQEIAEATAGTFLGRYLFDEYRNACAAWPRGSIRADARTPVSARVPTLLVSGWFDPSTPPEFAERVARSLPVSRLIVSRRTAHGSVGGCAAPAAVHLLATGSLTGLPDVCR